MTTLHDRAKAALEEMFSVGGGGASAYNVHRWASVIHKALDLAAQAETLERDAARYRWLRNNHLQTSPDSWIRTGDDLESAIDAAMKEFKP